MYYIQSICNAHFAFKNRVSSSLCYPENHICRREGATDPPKSASRHSQNAVSLPVRGSRVQRLSLPLTRRRLNGFISNPSSEERGQSPAARRSGCCLHKPTGGQRGIMGRRESGSAKLISTFFSPKCSDELAFSVLVFFFSPPFACFFCFPCLFFCFSLLFLLAFLLPFLAFSFCRGMQVTRPLFPARNMGWETPFFGHKGSFLPQIMVFFWGGYCCKRKASPG